MWTKEKTFLKEKMCPRGNVVGEKTLSGEKVGSGRIWGHEKDVS
jgi:hypothetical protein